MDMKLEVVVIPVSDADKAGPVRHMPATYDSAADPAQALRRAAAAHGKHTQATT